MKIYRTEMAVNVLKCSQRQCDHRFFQKRKNLKSAFFSLVLRRVQKNLVIMGRIRRAVKDLTEY